MSWPSDSTQRMTEGRFRHGPFAWIAIFTCTLSPPALSPLDAPAYRLPAHSAIDIGAAF